ncbi:uncharacterized protein LOC141525753 [Cotesia typhae]|uniref:uncharacterized protein LOC141525753 n=1 Tax=Cotesia typhae TaxID=2053667 RepID=UPI003D6878C6
MAENTSCISNSSHDLVSTNTNATTSNHTAAENFHEDVPNCNPLQVMSVLPDFLSGASQAIHIVEDNVCENRTTCANDNLTSTSTLTSAPDVDHVVEVNVTKDVPCSGQSSPITASISDDTLISEPGANDQMSDFTPNPYIHSNHILQKLKINHPKCFQQSFQLNLAECFTNNKINQTQSKAILNVLHTHPSLKFLPTDPRTLLMTPRDKIDPKIVEPGNYLHLGIEWMLLLTLSSLSLHEIPNELIIDFSTDGAEMNKNIQIWPIQIRIVNMEKIKKPILVGVYEGSSKPKSFKEFFHDFVEESKIIIKNGGIYCNEKLISITFRCFIADAPARSYVLNHMSHVSKNPCSKCKVEGITYLHSRRFPGHGYLQRTDLEYRELRDVDHHLGESSIKDLPIDLVKQVSFDYMHLTCLRVMKKIIGSVVYGKCLPGKLQKFEETFLSARLVELQSYCPRDFARMPREIQHYGKYKATEFRQLLLYSFIVVSLGIITTDQYDHFLLLHTSMRVLLNDQSSSEDIEFADIAIKKFIIDAEKIHGLEFLTYNSHGLVHLVEDFKQFGSLEDTSAFTYENVMKEYRDLINKQHQLLQQIYKRICEKSHFQNISTNNKFYTNPKGTMQHKNGPINDKMRDNCVQYKNLECSKFFYSTEQKDNTIQTRDGRVGVIKNIIFTNNKIYLAISFFKKLRPFYHVLDRPSTDFGIFQCSCLSSSNEFILLEDIKSKCYRMPI